MPTTIPTITINHRTIGAGQPVYIVAELSANHNQKYHNAVKILQAAKQAGAHAIKLQTANPDSLTIDSDHEIFRITGGTIWDGRTLYDLYQEVCTPWEWHPKLKSIAQDLGLDFFSSPYDLDAVDFLEELGVPAYKIASSEIVDLQIIRKAAQTGKPLIISTGMATRTEIHEAISTAHHAGATQIALLKCTTAYPAPLNEINLRTIPHMIQRFRLPVGLSDHSLEPAVPAAAVALGACIVEKHLTLSRSHPGPDTAFSLEPDEFKSMVQAVTTTEKALGEVCYGVSEHEKAGHAYRKSLFAVADIKASDPLTTQNVRSIRPACGLHPRFLDHVLGKRAAQDIKRGTPLSWKLIDKSESHP
jgi:pseudaminic acid synthase